jgi:hypothetical protein
MMEGDLEVATVWGSTWVLGRHPLSEDGVVGYAVAWIDLDEGERVQHLVMAEEAPLPGTLGAVTVEVMGGYEVPVFVPAGEQG